MINVAATSPGFEISALETCDFSSLNALYNIDVLQLAGQQKADKMAKFIEEKMGAWRRFHIDESGSALDLARQALSALVDKNPSILAEADFFIYAGISNPMPVATHSALLASEFGFHQPSCWDIKSGCSSGVLALIQANAWLQMGAQKGVIVASETLTKFADPKTLQMSAAVGDGAAALVVERSDRWRLKSAVHGTDPKHVHSMLVKGTIPVRNEDYQRENFRFSFQEKSDLVQALSHYWMKSLQDLLKGATISGSEIQHYIAHQVDAGKNAAVAAACDIPDSSVAKCFREFGNMGCPTIFVNYQQWFANPERQIQQGDHMVLHAVGGGLSWAGLCLEYTGD